MSPPDRTHSLPFSGFPQCPLAPPSSPARHSPAASVDVRVHRGSEVRHAPPCSWDSLTRASPATPQSSRPGPAAREMVCPSRRWCRGPLNKAACLEGGGHQGQFPGSSGAAPVSSGCKDTRSQWPMTGAAVRCLCVTPSPGRVPALQGLAGSARRPLRLGAPRSPRAPCQTAPRPAAGDRCLSDARFQRMPARTSAVLHAPYRAFCRAGRPPTTSSPVIKPIHTWISPVSVFLQHMVLQGWAPADVPVATAGMQIAVPILLLRARPAAPARTTAPLSSVTLALSCLEWDRSEGSMCCFPSVIFTYTWY